MKKQVTVSLPGNVTEKEMHLFEPLLSYDINAQKVKRFKNVFVTYSGFCINNRGLIKETHHDHPHSLKIIKTKQHVITTRY